METDINKLTEKVNELENRLAQSKENEKKARQLANQSIARTPPVKTLPPTSHLAERPDR